MPENKLISMLKTNDYPSEKFQAPKKLLLLSAFFWMPQFWKSVIA